MSTTLPETVTTTNTTTTSTTAPIGTTGTAGVVGTSAHPNPAAALDPLTESSSAGGSSMNTNEMLEKAKAAAISAGAAISSAAQQAGAAISSTAQSIDAKYHVSDKVSDATAHVTAALKHGHPAHAAKHATTAAAIGDAERAKHQAGPLADDAHAAAAGGGGLTSSTVHTSSSLGSSESTTDKISNSAADVASHVSAAVNAGNPLHAAKYAGTAAMIGQVEREKHAHGPLDDEASIASATDASKPQ